MELEAGRDLGRLPKLNGDTSVGEAEVVEMASSRPLSSAYEVVEDTLTALVMLLAWEVT